MTIKFGRAGLDVTVNDHDTYSVGGTDEGDEVTIGGLLSCTTQADANAVRQQMLGHLKNPWETVVPFMWSTDPSQDGLLRPDRGKVDSVLGVSYNGNAGYGFRYQLTATRMGGWNGAGFESSFDGTVLTNDHGITVGAGPTPWHALPNSITLYDFAGRADTPYTRVGPGGTAYVWNPGSGYYYSGQARWAVGLADHYAMAAGIRIGNPLRAVTGRQIVTVGNAALFELSNGLIKLECGTAPSSLKVSFPIYATPASWTASPRQVDLGYYAAGTWWKLGVPVSLAVVRCDPACSILRMYFRLTFGGGAAQTYVTADAVLRRGSRTIQLIMKSPIALTWGAKLAAGTAMTAYGAPQQGLRESANDGEGNRFVFHTSKTNTVSAGTGLIYSTSARQVMDIGLSGEIGGSGASAPDDYSTLNAQYYAAQTEFQDAVIP